MKHAGTGRSREGRGAEGQKVEVFLGGGDKHGGVWLQLMNELPQPGLQTWLQVLMHVRVCVTTNSQFEAL